MNLFQEINTGIPQNLTVNLSVISLGIPPKNPSAINPNILPGLFLGFLHDFRRKMSSKIPTQIHAEIYYRNSSNDSTQNLPRIHHGISPELPPGSLREFHKKYFQTIKKNSYSGFHQVFLYRSRLHFLRGYSQGILLRKLQ